MGISKLPIGIRSFEKLRTSGYLYIDKTGYVRDMVESGSVYFLSRPRRFGKSLLLSTIEAYFNGKRELFDGLEIESWEDARGESAWAEHPIVKFLLSGGEYQEEDGLRDRLAGTIESCIKDYGLGEEYAVKGETLAMRFQNLIKQLHAKTGRQVVVLVDEYDKPLLSTMNSNPAQEEKNRQFYKAFFSVLKDEDEHLRFVFFTGVTKFGKVSIFSDLNQLRDISMTNEFSGICGITEPELLENFDPELDEMAKSLGTSGEECLASLRKMYDGYHFSADSPGVYNPFSLLNALANRDLSGYWFSTGTPAFLVEKLLRSTFTPERLVDGVDAHESSITDYGAESPDPIPLFYQTGYLTIRGFDREFRIYSLGFSSEKRNIAGWRVVRA